MGKEAPPADVPADVKEQRKYERIEVSFSGKLFVPAGSTTVECSIVDLSAGGAGLLCSDPPPLQSFVVLYIDGMGRYEGVAVRYEDGVLGLQFQCGDAKRKRLIEKLNLYVQQGVTSVTQLRAHERVPQAGELFFIRPNGTQIRCNVLDISLEGMSLATNGRPPINELIQIGKTVGRVVRHHAQGIGVQFVAPDEARGAA
ncbi:MAG TPA: PilZ domain-containing protein [Rhizomicrobium sp.]|nr:PilZ domain-containing protein [Rhizomicrobium sp.]